VLHCSRNLQVSKGTQESPSIGRRGPKAPYASDPSGSSEENGPDGNPPEGNPSDVTNERDVIMPPGTPVTNRSRPRMGKMTRDPKPGRKRDPVVH